MKHHAKSTKHKAAAKKHVTVAPTTEAAFLAAAATRWLALRAAHGLSLQSLINKQKGR